MAQLQPPLGFPLVLRSELVLLLLLIGCHRFCWVFCCFWGSYCFNSCAFSDIEMNLSLL